MQTVDTDASGHGADLLCPPGGDEWIGLVPSALPAEAVGAWLVRPDCGASVVFTGTARDHSPGRPGVRELVYEAYEAPALARMGDVLAEARTRWPEVIRLAALHRLGEVPLGAAAVVVGASAAHRDPAFEAARFCIDAVKATVPIWKRERWDGGDDWGQDATALVEPADVTGESR